MNNQEAKETILRALPTLSSPQRLVVQGISALETGYGNWGPDPLLGAGSNNMGAVTDPSYRAAPLGQTPTPPAENQFLHQDSRPATEAERAKGLPDNIVYVTAFKKYPSPESGFQDMARIALKANVNEAIANNDLYGVSAAMYKNVYYTGRKRTAKENIDAHYKNLSARIRDIVKSTGDVNPFERSMVDTAPPLVPGKQPSPSPQSPLALPSYILQSILRVGSQGCSVEIWQKLVGGLVVDGIFGRKTEIATRNYQSQHGLKVDGIVGPQTWQSIATQLPSGFFQQS